MEEIWDGARRGTRTAAPSSNYTPQDAEESLPLAARKLPSYQSARSTGFLWTQNRQELCFEEYELS